MDDHYATLEVRPDAPPEVIAAAHRALCKVYGSGGTQADPQRMALIDRAHATLSDQTTRLTYDAERPALHGDDPPAAPGPQAASDRGAGWGGRGGPESSEDPTDVRVEDVGPQYVEDDPEPEWPGDPAPEPPPDFPIPDLSASMRQRCGALLVDLCVVAVVGLTWYQLAAVLLGSPPRWVPLAGWYVTFGLIHVVVQGRTGFTPGKRLLGLRAVRGDGRPPGLSWILVPFAVLPILITAWGALYSLGLAAVARHADQPLTEMGTRTYVLRAEHAARPSTSPTASWIVWLLRPVLRWLLGRRITRVLMVTAGLLLVLLAIVAGVRACAGLLEPEGPPLPVVQAIWRAHTDEATALAFSPDGDTLATASADGTVGLWDTSSYQRLATLDHGDEVTHLAFSSQGTVLTAANDESTTQWDTRTHEQVASSPTGPSDPGEGHARVRSPDGTLLVGPGDGATIEVWDVVADHPKGNLYAHNADVRVFVFSDDGSLLASADATGQVALWTNLD